MARTTSLSYTFGRKIGLAGFSSVTIEFSESVELEVGDDRDAVLTDLMLRVVNRVNHDASVIVSAQPAQRT